jgi:hypothetical protein
MMNSINQEANTTGEIDLRDLLNLLEELKRDCPEALIQNSSLIENTPLNPVWKRILELFLLKIRTTKRISNNRNCISNLGESEEGLLLKYICDIIESGDSRVADCVSTFLSEFIPLIKRLILLEPIFQRIANGLHSNLSRSISKRPALIGDPLINLDDTTGWHRLEAFVRLYHGLVRGVIKRDTPGEDVFLFIVSETIILDGMKKELDWYELGIESMAKHINRHLREMTFYFLANIFDDISPKSLENPLIVKFCRRCLSQIPDGLGDDWSQIRYASSKAFLSLFRLLSKLNLTIVDDFYCLQLPQLIPRICLNRYHPARSVQSVSLEIWKTCFSPNGIGKELLILHFLDVRDYYLESISNKNHMISEAACHAIGEIYEQLSGVVVTNNYENFLVGLENALKDQRWPVRDAAQIPSAVVLQKYENKIDRVREFYPLWATLLQDSIMSVRENSAFSFSRLLSATSIEIRKETKSYCSGYVKENLLRALIGLNGNSKKITSFLPVGMLSKSEPSQEKQALKKGWGCCIDCADIKPALDWEISHGAVILLREIAIAEPSFLSSLMSFRSNSSLHQEMNCVSALDLLMDSNTYDHCQKLQAEILRQVRKPLQCYILS